MKRNRGLIRNHYACADGGARFALKGLALSLMLAFGANAYALPTGGAVSAGSASIAGGAGKVTINQSSQNVAINWQSFSIGQTEAVQFVQPNSSSVALNRVLGADASSIMGSLSANGKVFLVNPNGILFGKGAQVNVGGLVASTRNITDGDFMAGNYKFAGTGGGTIVNQGSINADGGYVALLGASISNEGVISARLGTVALAAGNAFTLDVAGDGLLNVMVNQGALNALVQNGGLIRADGGQVLMTALSAGNLLQSAVNNTGVIQAQTVENHNGTIRLMGDMQSGTVNAGGRLDASAPNGGNGGFIETSAAVVNVANDAKFTTAAPMGRTGTWLIDPQDFIIGAGGNVLGVTIQGELVNNNVTITTNTGVDTFVAGAPPTITRNTATPGNGDIFVNDAIAWNGGAAANATTLTLSAARDVIFRLGADITATVGNLVVCCGRDITVNSAISTTNGSVLLSAGRNANLNGTIATSNGNISVCAGHDVIVNATITLVNSGSIPAQGLGLPLGLVLSAGNDGTGPGVAGGTVLFNPLFPASITRSQAPVTDVTINYNPVAYTAPTDYLPNLILAGGVTVFQHMLVFPGGASKSFDGTTAAVFSSLKGNPVGVSLSGAGIATFDTPDVGTGKTITFTGFTLSGVNAGNFALPATCCGPIVGRTTADISPSLLGSPIATMPVLQGFLPALAGLDLAVLGGGIRMPPLQLADTAPAQTEAMGSSLEALPGVVPPAALPAAVPAEAPPIYAPPQRLRKRDRE